MGRYTTKSIPKASTLGTITATKVAPPGYLGDFGNRLFSTFQSSGNFTVPTGVTSIRVRVFGGGGGGKSTGGGGGGGGHAYGTFTVTPATVYAVTIGAAGTGGASPTAGGTSSFGVLLSATGGGAGGTGTGGAGGTGTGGDFQATGGAAGNVNGSGGAGAGSQFGTGGATVGAGSGGGGLNGGVGSNGNAGSAFGSATSTTSPGPDVIGASSTNALPNGSINAISAPIRFYFDGATGGAGSSSSGTGGIGGPGAGGGGGSNAGAGGVGGIGGGGGGNSQAGAGGKGGLCAGGGGSVTGAGADGGQGFVVVEW